MIANCDSVCASKPGQSLQRGLLRIGEVASRFSICETTIRRATADGTLPCFTLPSGHRRFSESDVLTWLGVENEETGGEENPTSEVPIAMVCRVSSDGQNRKQGNSEESSMDHQIKRVSDYCLSRWGRLGKLYKSVGSGLNFDRPEFVTLIEDILAMKYAGGFIVATDFTRLCRFGVRMLEIICQQGQCEIVYTMDNREEKSENESLVDDVLSVLTHFTAKASGKKARLILKVNMPGELLREAFTLYQNGWTYKDISKELCRRGEADEKGREFTPYIVRTCIEENRPILEKENTPEESSFEQFVSEHVKPAAKGRLNRKELYQRYREWCEENGHYEISNVKLAEIIDGMGWDRHRNKHKSIVYWGIELA